MVMVKTKFLNFSAILKMWRDDRKCGYKYYNSNFDTTVSQCNPDGQYPCCNHSYDGLCSAASLSNCSCYHCTDYRIVYRDWRRSGGKQRWRSDKKCGIGFPLADGTGAECDPDGMYPCCGAWGTGRCGNEKTICSCDTCLDFRILYRDWRESEGKQRWGYDGRCGRWRSLPDGTGSQCDPDGKKPCCSNSRLQGRCGNTSDCDCNDCKNYNHVNEGWKKSGRKIKWRNDEWCGYQHPFPDGTPAECNPEGEKPCCSQSGKCRTPHSKTCACTKCIDYRIVKKIRESRADCTIVRLNLYLKYVCFNETSHNFYYKCFNSDVYYEARLKDIDLLDSNLHHVTSVCDNDTHSYQACGFNTLESATLDAVCGGFFCKQEGSKEHKYVTCSGDDCKVDNRQCQNKPRYNHTQHVCNDKCNMGNCKDEGYCNGHTYGVFCTSAAGDLDYVPPQFVCDGGVHCFDGSDEENCDITNSTVNTCNQIRSNITVPIFNYTRCSLIKYCAYDHLPLDQTNCSDVEKVGGYCKVGGFMTRVSKYMTCEDKYSKICDDNLHKNCISPSFSGCKVHKHRMCDQKHDCPDGSDEINEICEVMTSTTLNFTCQRRFTLNSSDAGIPFSWIMDGFTDCMSGEDEDESKWNLCRGDVRQISLPGEKCHNLFRCPGKDNSSVRFDQLCDGIETCREGRENRVCQMARDFPDSKNKAQYIQSTRVRDLCQDTNDCATKEFRRPWGDVFGEPTIELFLPNIKINCSRLFGEHYLFISCMNHCLEENVTCPIDGNNRKLDILSCPKQFQNRSYTIANNSFLTFVVESDGGHYHQDFYKCNNSRCIEYKQVCDLVDDCGDMSDEMGCANHMICEDTRKSKKQQFVSLSHRCDGIYDCFDMSDECNEFCKNDNDILGNWMLKSLCWFMGILAVLLNLFSTANGLMSIKTCRTGATMITKALISLIGSGDFLIGLYLIILSVYDSIIFGSSYCRRQPVWLTGFPCKVLGVISTVGSQVSVFSMTLMSFIKMYGVTLSSMRIPFPVNKKAVAKAIFLASSIVLSSLAIALIPLVPSLEDYFVQGMYYHPSYKVFIGFPNKDRHMKVLQEYYKSVQNISKNTLSWKEIGEKVDGMFTQDYGVLTRNPVHFYGNDGVCLFKYFVRTDDARRSRNSSLTEEEAKYSQQDPVVWIMLAVNLICFIIITACYIRITWKTGKSTRQSEQCDNPEIRKENRDLQRRVMLIIATDFLCWVPFIFVSGLHNLGKIDASSWYVPFAMTVLPINSVINPLIYNKVLVEMIKIKLGVMGGYIRQGLTLAWITLTNLFRRNKEDAEPENIPMEVLNQ